VQHSALARRVAASSLAPVAAFPVRLTAVARLVGDTVEFVAGPVARRQPIGLPIVDTGFTAEHERAELATAEQLLAPDAVALSTKTFCWPELQQWRCRPG
jgi:hypothetical protein